MCKGTRSQKESHLWGMVASSGATPWGGFFGQRAGAAGEVKIESWLGRALSAELRKVASICCGQVLCGPPRLSRTEEAQEFRLKPRGQSCPWRFLPYIT